MQDNNFENVFNDLLEIKEIQTYQDIFCEAQKVFLRCFDKNGKTITRLSGRKTDIDRLYEYFGRTELNNLIRQTVKDNSNLKEAKQMDTIYENVKLNLVPNYAGKIFEGTWVMITVIKKAYDEEMKVVPMEGFYGKLSENAVNRSIKLLNILSDMFISSIFDKNKNIEKLKEVSEKEYKVREELKRKESMTKILEILESDEEFESIINGVIKEVSTYLDISVLIMAKVDEEQHCIEIIGKHYDDLNIDRQKLEKYLPLDVIEGDSNETIFVIEPDETNFELKKILRKYGLKSLISVPILSERAPAIYAIFAETKYERYWDSSTVRFLFDVCKMTQSFIYKRISKNSLISSYTALKEILNNLGSGIFVVDKETKKILFCNDLLTEIYGKDYVGEQCYDLIYGMKNDICNCCQPQSSEKYVTEVYDKRQDKWFEMGFHNIVWVDGKEVSLCNVMDITDKKKYQSRIEFQANNDFLTGLYNRMKCEEDLHLIIKDSASYKENGALLFIDLDDFKHINDGLGHQYGDMLLKMIATGLKQIKEIEKRCYRVGGDEFVIIIEQKYFGKMKYILSDIQKLFASPWYLGDNEYYCTMSMGIVIFPDNGQDVNDLIKKADIAMYDAKKSGKNRYVFYNAGEDKYSSRKLDIEKNMRDAVAGKCSEFKVYIQPIVSAETEKCIGGEALVRWDSKRLGFLTPGDFIPMAEHMGLIEPIGEYVLKESCKLNRKWEEKGINVRINVNLSVIQLLSNDVVNVISNIIKETNVNPSHLVLEVTESLAINDMTRMKKIIDDIKKLGIKIALDDFGTGYSSLNYIKNMNLDIIKVDRTFIKDIAEDDYAQAFVKLIAELSKKLEVQVCVEGVEDEKQLETLKNMEISMIQGFYYGKPMKIEEFENKFLEKKG